MSCLDRPWKSPWKTASWLYNKHAKIPQDCSCGIFLILAAWDMDLFVGAALMAARGAVAVLEVPARAHMKCAPTLRPKVRCIQRLRGTGRCGHRPLQTIACYGWISTGTPLTSTPSSARMRMYLAPPRTRVSTRSRLSGATWIFTSGVSSSKRLGSMRLPGFKSA